MKVFREEFFGGILYDSSSLSYKIIVGKENIIADRFIPLSFTPERTDILSAPVRVYFEFTRKCNLACRHCFASSSPSLDEGMSTSLVFSLLEDMKNSGVINVRFTGGEPTARSDWYEVLSYAKSLGLIVSLSSNGVFSDPDDTVSKIASLALEQVTFSIDGLEKTHDYLRGKGTFNSMLAALEKLKAKGVPLRLTTVLTRQNLEEIPQIVELANKYVKVINFVFMRVLGRADKKLALTFREHYESAGKIPDLQEKYPDLLILHSALPLPKQFLLPQKSSGLSFSSSYANTSLNVASDGTFWPHHYSSHQTPEFMFGKYPENLIKEIWLKSEKLDAFRKWSGALLERCFACQEFRQRCSGFNFETEMARLAGDAEENFCCINQSTPPSPWEFFYEAWPVT